MKQNQLVKTHRLSQVPLWGYVYSTNCALEALGDFSSVVSVSGYLCCFAGCSFVIFKKKRSVAVKCWNTEASAPVHRDKVRFGVVHL